MLNQELSPASRDRIQRALALRTFLAGRDAFATAPAQLDNGDEALYADKSGTYTKGLLQTEPSRESRRLRCVSYAATGNSESC